MRRLGLLAVLGLGFCLGGRPALTLEGLALRGQPTSEPRYTTPDSGHGRARRQSLDSSSTLSTASQVDSSHDFTPASSRSRSLAASTE